MDFKNGEDVTLLDILDNELVFRSPLAGTFQNFLAFIEVVTVGGTGIQFSSGEDVPATAHKWQVGDKIPMSFFPNTRNLHAKTDSINDVFVITV